jgi:hypothetical protein
LFTPIKDIPVSRWEALSEKKIYFGHQSVGFNIIDGLKDLMKENPQIKLNIVESHDPADFSSPLFAHSPIGKNYNPISKIDDFKKFMDNGIGNNADIAFFKFCFVDVTAETDIQKIFNYYREVMNYLKEKYPKTIFVHVTVPLTTVQSGPKAFIKKIIGKPIDGYADNIRRNQFNGMLRKEYEGKAPIFDIARIESTFPNRKSLTFINDGKAFYTLIPEYTHDGGHLNETGRKIVAQSLLVLLAQLIEQ